MGAENVTQSVSKIEIAIILAIDPKTLATYCNVRYFEEMKKIGYEKHQKKLTPIQVNYLKEKLGF